jgi:uncharacterized protein
MARKVPLSGLSPELAGQVPPFHVMTKPRGPVCNLDCTYCYYLSKERLYPDSDFRMSEEVLERFIRQYLAAQPYPEVTFAWQGGEPLLMGLDFFRRVVDLQQRHRRPGQGVRNTLQTNGVLLDDDWCTFLAEQDFLVGISLDGPARLHDIYRVDKGGAPTFAAVRRGLAFLQEHRVEHNALVCVHAANAPHPLEVYRSLRDDLGLRFLQFIPVVERVNETGFQEGEEVTERSVSGRQWGAFLVAVFNEWVRQDVGTVFVQLFDVTLASWLGMRPGLCIFEETCGQALALEHDGDLYACDHFVEPRWRLGNLMETPLAELAVSETLRRFGEAKRDGLPRTCRECEVLFACRGECPKNRILATPDGEPGLNWLCEGYMSFFRHVDPAMRFMATELKAGRPPAGVMAASDRFGQV